MWYLLATGFKEEITQISVETSLTTTLTRNSFYDAMIGYVEQQWKDAVQFDNLLSVGYFSQLKLFHVYCFMTYLPDYYCVW